MDTLSHAAWGYASLRWRGKKEAWCGAAAGAAPDLFFFIPFATKRIAKVGWSGFRQRPAEGNIWRADGPPMPQYLIDAYYDYYVWTHSLVVVAFVLLAIYLLHRWKWLWLAVPYVLHILMDLPTHERYQTPIFFPLATWTFQGVSWGTPWIFYPNWVALLTVQFWLWLHYRKACRTPG